MRRLPVIDGHDLVGMVAQADIARSISDDKVGDLVELISSCSLSTVRDLRGARYGDM